MRIERIGDIQVESARDQTTRIPISYDFYRQTYGKPNIKWLNLYRCVV